MGGQTDEEFEISFFNIKSEAEKVEGDVKEVAMTIKDKIETVGLGFISGLSESE